MSRIRSAVLTAGSAVLGSIGLSAGLVAALSLLVWSLAGPAGSLSAVSFPSLVFRTDSSNWLVPPALSPPPLGASSRD